MAVMVSASRTSRRFILKVLTVLVAVAAAWALAGPAVSQAAVIVQRLGYCGGDDWEPTVASDSTHVYILITHYTGNTACDPASPARPPSTPQHTESPSTPSPSSHEMKSRRLPPTTRTSGQPRLNDKVRACLTT